MPQSDADVLILGAGCAGLAIAQRLAGTGLAVRLVEPRTAYTEDRTWSFWTGQPQAYGDALRRKWSAWSVSNRESSVRRTSARLHYVTLSSERVYASALRTIDASDTLTLHRGTRVVAEPQACGEGRIAVETDRGRLIGRTVVDTRPANIVADYGQSFVGREICTERAVFDAHTVGLMHFAPPQADRIGFVYVLPFAPDRALIETTCFAPPGATGDLEADLERACDAFAAGAAWQEVRRERGFIPMTAAGPKAQTDTPGLVRAGLAGGAARPSTGYAFQRIQHAATVCAERLARGAPPAIAYPEGAVSRWMDGLFLSVLRRWPEAGPDLMMRMFRHTPRDRLERFLSGSISPADRLAVVRSLPPGPFLQALVSP
jgi:lycopene beta-cyclase